MKTQLTYKFRLSQKDVKSGLQSHIDELAEQRQLTDEIKTALTLLAQLRNGDRQLLDSMFPNICTPPPTPPNSDEISRRLANIEAKLDTRPMNDPNIPDTRPFGVPAMKPAGYAPAIAAPVAVATAAVAPSADDICDNFMAFLQSTTP